MVLQIDMDATQTEIMLACQSAVARDRKREAEFVEARNTLLNADARLLAELRFFADAPKPVRLALMKKIPREIRPSHLIADWEEMYPLTFWNLLTRYCMMAEPNIEVLRDYASSQMLYHKKSVAEAINGLHDAAGVAQPNADELLNAISDKLTENVSIMINRYPKDKVSRDLLIFLEDALPPPLVEMYAIYLYPLSAYLALHGGGLNEERVEIETLAKAAAVDPGNNKLLGDLEHALTRRAVFMKPLVFMNRHILLRGNLFPGIVEELSFTENLLQTYSDSPIADHIARLVNDSDVSAKTAEPPQALKPSPGIEAIVSRAEGRVLDFLARLTIADIVTLMSFFLLLLVCLSLLI